jgi:ribosome recycling factor
MAAEDLELVHGEAKQAMDRSVHGLRAELQKVRTGRASTALLDGIQVEYYGTQTPMNQLANMSTPDPRLIVISPYDKSTIAAIEKAVLTSNLGLTPSSDGKVVRIPIPSLTEERRKELVKHVHRLAEDHKVGVREARRDALALIKDLETEGSVPADDRRREEKRIQTLTDEHIQKIEEMKISKEEEILQV